MAQNDSRRLDLPTATLPLNRGSIAGYVALTREPLNLPDAYAVPPGAEFQFNPRMDQQFAYRTVSMLAVPMLDLHVGLPGRRDAAGESRPGEISDPQEVPAPSQPATPRHVPARVRERVLERAEYRCEFRGPDGTRCSSRTGLEIEHVKPFAIFRDHDERFLEALCPGHNRYRAERVYGKEFIRRKIEERSARGAPPIAVARVPCETG